MKNKKLTYVLLAVVAGIWGFIFYRIFASVAPGDLPATAAHRPSVPVDTVENLIPGQFELMADYRDPFLGSDAIPVAEEKNIPETATEELYMDWSFVRYVGVISNRQAGKTVSLVNIHGQDYMMREGMAVQEVKLVKNYGDSIKISYQGQTTCIRQ